MDIEGYEFLALQGLIKTIKKYDIFIFFEFSKKLVLNHDNLLISFTKFLKENNLKIFNSELIPVAFNDHFLSKWLFDVEIFFRLKKHFGTSAFRTMSTEIPLQHWKDQGGSKIQWTYGFKMWMDLFKIKRTYQ